MLIPFKKFQYLSFILVLKLLLIPSSFALSSEPIYCKISTQLINEISNHLATNCNLSYGGGGGQFLSQVNKISTYYSTDIPFSLETARKLYLSTIQQILNAINNDKSIRPYLAEFPFSIERLGCTLSFRKRNINLDYISTSVMHINGKIFYSTYNITKQKTLFKFEENIPHLPILISLGNEDSKNL